MSLSVDTIFLFFIALPPLSLHPSSSALEEFLKKNRLSHVIRAHECMAAGFQVSQIHRQMFIRKNRLVLGLMTIWAVYTLHVPPLSLSLSSPHSSSRMAACSLSSPPLTTVAPLTRLPASSYTTRRLGRFVSTPLEPCHAHSIISHSAVSCIV